MALTTDHHLKPSSVLNRAIPLSPTSSVLSLHVIGENYGIPDDGSLEQKRVYHYIYICVCVCVCDKKIQLVSVLYLVFTEEPKEY